MQKIVADFKCYSLFVHKNYADGVYFEENR
jgi:hypothetical protein